MNSSRRQFLASASALPLGTLGTALVPAAASTARADDGNAPANTLAGRFYKTLKLGMIKEGKTLPEKFAAAKEAGFEGVELHAPGFDLDEARRAVEETGLVVDGTLCAEHWQVRHSDPDPAVRKRALDNLLGALRATREVGGHTVLVVPGKGEDGSQEETWQRCVENISKALPLASKLGVVIAIENVWNQLFYDHEGGPDQDAGKFAAFIDAFDSPWVGLQFDIGNHWKYGNTGDWIRTLGKRIVKLDVKGFSRAEDKFTKIGEGDLDFADVTKALLEIDFHGWCAAEVRGGDLERLKEISGNMDRAFGLKG